VEKLEDLLFGIFDLWGSVALFGGNAMTTTGNFSIF
jgi:hypothetical protein